MCDIPYSCLFILKHLLGSIFMGAIKIFHVTYRIIVKLQFELTLHFSNLIFFLMQVFSLDLC